MKKLVVVLVAVVILFFVTIAGVNGEVDEKALKGLIGMYTTTYYAGYYDGACKQIYLGMLELYDNSTDIATHFERICHKGMEDKAKGEYNLEEVLAPLKKKLKEIQKAKKAAK